MYEVILTASFISSHAGHCREKHSNRFSGQDDRDVAINDEYHIMHVRHGQVEQCVLAQTEHLHEFTMDAREDESQEHGSCRSCSLVFDRAAPLIPKSGIPPLSASRAFASQPMPARAAVKIPHDFLQGPTAAAILSDMQGNDFCRPPPEIVVGTTEV